MKRRKFIFSLSSIAGILGISRAEVNVPPRDVSLFGAIEQKSKLLKVLPRGKAAVQAGEFKIHILGACSGTWPEPKAKHTALILQEPDGTPLWFDAGEFSSWTAYLMNIDFTKLNNVFISHPHTDHTAGLHRLFATFQHGYHKKNVYSQAARKIDTSLDVYCSSQKVVDSAYSLFWESNRGFHNFHANRKSLRNGLIFEDKEVAVDALANHHMGNDQEGNPLSYSFRMRLKNGRVIIFSGDVRDVDDMQPWLETGCDLLMMETGHHRAVTVCGKLKKSYPKVKDVFFLHHGVQVLRNPLKEKECAEKVWGEPIIFAEDGMSLAFL